MTFAETYKMLFAKLLECKTNVISRGMLLAHEMPPQMIDIEISKDGASIFSHKFHRVVPIRFILAEFCHILSGQSDLATIKSYSKVMGNYSDDGINLNSAYGKRLSGQFEAILFRLGKDIYSRQACMTLFSKEDALDLEKVHIPCNVFIQALYRDNVLSSIVNSRSSDFVTGFSIDSIHWQLMLILLSNQLHESFFPCASGNVYYCISSLHIYEKDMHIVEEWQHPLRGNFEYFIKPTIGITKAIEACKKYFGPKLSLDELMDILELPQESRFVCALLDDIYKNYRNKLSR